VARLSSTQCNFAAHNRSVPRQEADRTAPTPTDINRKHNHTVCLFKIRLRCLLKTHSESNVLHGRTDRYIHMTNVNMIPLLSWGSVNLDWEWRDQGGQQMQDVQTRNQIGCDDSGQHCNDTSFILAQTAGLQSGNIPIAISSGLRGPNCTARPDLFGANCTAWLMKTQYATCIPHEVRPEGTPWGLTHIAGSPDGAFEETPTTTNVSTVLDVCILQSRCILVY
jgi:hypothetical protein